MAPFIVIPAIAEKFEFRCLRENRRVVQERNRGGPELAFPTPWGTLWESPVRRPSEEEGREEELENFHHVLGDISMGSASNEVRKFIIDSYVRGAKIGNAEAANFEGNTAVSWGQTTHTSTSPPPIWAERREGGGPLQVFTKRRYRRGRKNRIGARA